MVLTGLGLVLDVGVFRRLGLILAVFGSWVGRSGCLLESRRGRGHREG